MDGAPGLSTPKPGPDSRKAGKSGESESRPAKPSEQLNQRISVIPPAMRLLAFSTTILVVAALVWAVFGTVPTRVYGSGVVIADLEGNFAVATVTAGPVTEVLVRPGDKVKAGATIVVIEQKLLAVRIQNAESELRHLENNLAILKDAHVKQIEHTDETTKRQVKAIEEQVAKYGVLRDRLNELVGTYKKLREKGMISENELLSKQQQADQIELSLADAAAKKILVQLVAETKRDDLQEMQRVKKVEIDLKKAEVERLKAEMAVGTSVTAPISGVIRELRVGRGEVAAAGAVVATMGEERDGHYQVVTLLRGDSRKRVAVGMEAQVVPDSVKREEYGSMKGRVLRVSAQDVSDEDVDRILHNRQLTKSLFDGQQALLARIDLVPTTDNKSGFEWWSGQGPPFKILPGTVANIDVIVDRVRPITLVIPALRKLLSIEG
jgi:HlyD family secretion protein